MAWPRSEQEEREVVKIVAGGEALNGNGDGELSPSFTLLYVGFSIAGVVISRKVIECYSRVQHTFDYGFSPIYSGMDAWVIVLTPIHTMSPPPLVSAFCHVSGCLDPETLYSPWGTIGVVGIVSGINRTRMGL
ncbi:hypothetical protein TIFTF001_034291 [Ficus carica]|uniref:Uncharacterized protein n=1 Tax=Ficus carica TaxID=3494 RepID=A0AA88E098_FICCA|nr:hypothetical protein TIFTF001_034291 [Ficus carica]